MDTKTLRPLLKLLREMGVTNYETPELKLTLDSVSPETSGHEAPHAMPEERELTEEERMFYSAPAVPDTDA